MGFMYKIPSDAPKSLTSETFFSKSLLIDDAYSKIPNLYGIEKVTTEEFMDKMDMFQSRFEKIDESGWWDLEIISADVYLDRFQRRMPKLRSSFEFSGT